MAGGARLGVEAKHLGEAAPEIPSDRAAGTRQASSRGAAFLEICVRVCISFEMAFACCLVIGSCGSL